MSSSRQSRTSQNPPHSNKGTGHLSDAPLLVVWASARPAVARRTGFGWQQTNKGTGHLFEFPPALAA